MSIAANFLKQSRTFAGPPTVGTQLSTNLVSATSTSGNINIPNVPDINVGRLAPKPETTPSTTTIRARREQRASVTQRYKQPTGIDPVPKVELAGYEAFGAKLEKSLDIKKYFNIKKYFKSGEAKDGGFITKK